MLAAFQMPYQYTVDYDYLAEHDATMLVATKLRSREWYAAAWPALGTVYARRAYHLIAEGTGKTREQAATRAWKMLGQYFQVKPLDPGTLRWQRNDGRELLYPVPMRAIYVTPQQIMGSSTMSALDQLASYYQRIMRNLTQPAVVASYRADYDQLITWSPVTEKSLWGIGENVKAILAGIPNNPSTFKPQWSGYTMPETEWQVVERNQLLDDSFYRGIAAFSSLTMDYGDVLFYGPVDQDVRVAVRKACRSVLLSPVEAEIA